MRSLVCSVLFVACFISFYKAQDVTKGSILLKRLARHARQYSSSVEDPWKNWQPMPKWNFGNPWTERNNFLDNFFNSSRPTWQHHHHHHQPQHDWHHHDHHNPCTCQKPHFPEFPPPPKPEFRPLLPFPCLPGLDPPFPTGCKVYPPQFNSTCRENVTTPSSNFNPPQFNTTQAPDRINVTATGNPLLPSTTASSWGAEWPDLQDEKNGINEEDLPAPEVA